jgi:hypothetical protein
VVVESKRVVNPNPFHHYKARGVSQRKVFVVKALYDGTRLFHVGWRYPDHRGGTLFHLLQERPSNCPRQAGEQQSMGFRKNEARCEEPRAMEEQLFLDRSGFGVALVAPIE